MGDDRNINTRQLHFVNHEPETGMEETPLQDILENVSESSRRNLETPAMSNRIEPLSSFLRPNDWNEFAGQKSLVGEGAPIRKIIES